MKKSKKVFLQFSQQELEVLLKQLETPDKTNYIPQQNSKSNLGHIGLKNLGCICYINASVQQLFLTAPFRQAILSLTDGQEQNFQKDRFNDFIDDNVLHQLQYLFSFLKFSNKSEYNPYNFCFSLKEKDGSPINVGIQQDSQEFLDYLFDKVENRIKETPFKNVINQIYGGSWVDQMTCQNCQHRKEVEQIYTTLQLEVKNLNNVDDSLKVFTKNETVDYKCEECNEKVDLNKQFVFKNLPNVLILHLKRIFFDFETLMNIKVNSRYEFQDILDMYDYTVDAQNQIYKDDNRDNYKYRLVGVIIHQGSAEQGHYTSIINTSSNPNEEKWIEFDDNRISVFNKSELENETFGGESSNFNPNQYYGWFNRSRENNKNGYMLFYEKIIKNDIQLEFKNEDQIRQFQQKLNLNINQKSPDDLKPLIKYKDLEQLNFYEPSINQIVVKDNSQALLEKSIFNEKFYNFIIELVHILFRNDQNIQQIQRHDEVDDQLSVTFNNILSHTLYKVLFKAYDNKLLPEFVQKIQKLIELTPQNSLDYLDQFAYQRLNQVKDCLYDQNYTSQVRQSQQQILNQVIRQVIQNENIQELYIDILSQLNPQIERFKLFINDILSQKKGKQTYCEFLYSFLQGGQVERNFLYEKFGINHFVQMYIDEKDTIYYTSQNNLKKPVQNKYDNNLKIIIYLLTNRELSESKIFINNEFWSKLVTDPANPDLVEQIITIVCKNNFVSENAINNLLKQLSQDYNENIKYPLQALQALLLIDDQYKIKRMYQILGFPSIVTRETDQIKLLGISNNMSLFEPIYNYQSFYINDTIDLSQTLLSKFISNVNPSSHQNAALICLYYILNLCLESDHIFNYICQLESPIVIYENFNLIFNNFIELYNKHQKNSWYFQCKDEYIQNIETLLEHFNEKYSQNIQPQKTENLITGHITDEQYEVLYDEDDIIITQYIYDLFAINSYPDNKTNMAIPDSLLGSNTQNQKIIVQARQIWEGSYWNAIFYNKENFRQNKDQLLQIKQQIQDDQNIQQKLDEDEDLIDLKIKPNAVKHLVIQNKSLYDYQLSVSLTDDVVIKLQLSKNSKKTLVITKDMEFNIKVQIYSRQNL